MDTLYVSLFGHVTVAHGNGSMPAKLSRGTQALLAYLLLHKRPIAREILLDTFWMDHVPDRARSSLTTALWRLRQLLEPDGVRPGTYLIATNTGEVGFNWDSSYWLDFDAFERQINPLLRKPLIQLSDEDINTIEGVLPLYRGELLEGLYDDWALCEREHFRSLHLNCLTRLMEYYTSRQHFEQSIALAHEILRRDPVREEIHRALMRIYLENGQRTLAIRQYTQCRDLLDKELGVTPLEETELLYQQITAPRRPHARPGIESSTDREIARLVYELQLVKQSLIETVRGVERIEKALSNSAQVGANPSLGTNGRRR